MKIQKNILNWRVGIYYALGSLTAALLSFAAWPWTSILIWPAVALAWVAAAYFGKSGTIYRKRNGRVPFAARTLLAPAFLGQVLSWQYYRRSCAPWNEAVPRVLIGRFLTKSEAVDLTSCGVSAVVDLTAEFSEVPVLRMTEYRNLPLLDLTAPSTAEMREMASFIAEQTNSGNTVYVHCKVGYSRTAAVVGAFLMASGHAHSTEAAIAKLRSARPGIIIRPEARHALEAFAEEKGGNTSMIRAGC